MLRRSKKIKKHLISFAVNAAVAGILFSTPATVSAAVIQDIDLSSNYAREAIAALAEQNIIVGDENGHFHPHKTITRAEIITMLVNALHIDTKNIPEKPTFKDVPSTHWAYPHVEAAYREGIIQGLSDGTFGEDKPCTREQMAVIFVNALGLSQQTTGSKELNYINLLIDKDKISSWAKNAVEFSLASGLMQGTGNGLFEPKKSAQKQQAALLIYRMLSEKEEVSAFAENESQAVRYPELYNALDVNKPYRGEFNMNASMHVREAATEKTTALAVYGNGAASGTDRQMKMALSIDAPESNRSSFTFEMIQTGNKRYVKEADLGGWLEAEPEDIGEIVSFGMFPLELQKINRQFLKIYNTVPIEKIDSVEVEGVLATKYILFLNNQILKDLLPEELQQDMDFQILPDDIPLNFQIEFYLDAQQRIIKEVIKLNGDFEEEGKNFILDMIIDVNFKNIGADIQITAPENVIDKIDTSQPIQQMA
ncbi:MAG TPA: S-layer homology domain-containing protein [Clostridiales bacterium]|nr:S-layer homology domain-containing protein [Clostridiales bacterium]